MSLFVAKLNLEKKISIVLLLSVLSLPPYRGKLMIGSKMCHALLDKIKYDL